MAQPIQIGIAGLGRAGYTMHCDELKGREGRFRIVAACDPLEDRCSKMAEAYSCKTYPGLVQMIADPEVELVDIATRSADHSQHAIMALEAGKWKSCGSSQRSRTAPHSKNQVKSAIYASLRGLLIPQANDNRK